MGIRLPGRGDRGDAVGDDRVRRAVARDDVQRVARPVGDPGVQSAARPARVTDGLRPRERPARLSALGVERHELVSPRGDDEEPARRPRRVLVVAEQALRAVLLDDPRAFRRQNEQAARGRAASRARAAKAPARRRRGSGRRPPCPAASAPRPRSPRQPRARRAARGAFAVQGIRSRDSNAARRAPTRGQLRRLRPGGAPAGGPGVRGFAHDCSLITRSCMVSRPRRRRELTVPRGSSSSSAISPGE